MIDNKFLYFQTHDAFDEQLNGGNISQGSIAFIEDSSTIWTHGKEYDASGGEDNVIEQIKVNNTALIPDANRSVNITVPTQLSDLTSDSTHRVVTDAEKASWDAKLDNISAYSKEQVNEILATLEGGTAKVVSSLPTASTDTQGDIYYVTSGLGNSLMGYVTVKSGSNYSWANVVNYNFSDVGNGYAYKGVAMISTNPDTTASNVFYILGEVGTYPNMGSIVHASGIGIALWNGTAWTMQTIPLPTDNNALQRDLQIETILGVNNYWTWSYSISSGGVWGSASAKHIVIPVLAGQTIKITKNDDRNFQYCILKSYSLPISGASPDFATGYSAFVSSQGATVTVPDDGKFLYLLHTSGGLIYLPKEVTIDGYDMFKDYISYVNYLKNELKSYTDSSVASVVPQITKPASDFPTLSWSIRRTPSSFQIEDILSTLGTPSYNLYVDAVNGSDSNNGNSPTTAFKTIKQALIKNGSHTTLDYIHILGENPVFFASDLLGQKNVAGKIILKCDAGRAKFVNGISDTFNLVSNTSHTYKTATGSTTQIVGVVWANDSRKDSFGLYEPLTAVTSAAAVETTTNSYYIANESGTYHAYVNVDDTTKLDKVYPILTGYQTRFQFLTASNDTLVYMSNIDVISGFYLNRTAGSNKSKFVAENCTFQHSFGGDLIPDNNTDECYFINCVGGYAKADIFNSHTSSIMTEAQRLAKLFVTINCIAEFGGIYATAQNFNNNLFTAHNAMNVLRCGCRGAQSFGPLVADVNGCYSINVDCECVNDYFTTTNSNINGVFVFNSVQDGPTRTAKAILQNCRGYDVRTSSLAHSDGEIIASNVDWTKIVANTLSYQGQTII